jgi:2-keto-3-deoxy-galactonokinase
VSEPKAKRQSAFATDPPHLSDALKADPFHHAHAIVRAATAQEVLEISPEAQDQFRKQVRRLADRTGQHSPHGSFAIRPSEMVQQLATTEDVRFVSGPS